MDEDVLLAVATGYEAVALHGIEPLNLGLEEIALRDDGGEFRTTVAAEAATGSAITAEAVAANARRTGRTRGAHAAGGYRRARVDRQHAYGLHAFRSP